MATIRKYNKSNRKEKSGNESGVDFYAEANPKAKKQRKSKMGALEAPESAAPAGMALYPVYGDFRVDLARASSIPSYPIEHQGLYYTPMCPGQPQSFMGYAGEMSASACGAGFSNELVIFNQASAAASTAVQPLAVAGPGSEKRLMSINEAFELLRVHIPTFPYERRLSKIDTLHLTISYIGLLEAILESNLNLYDYLKNAIHSSFGSGKSKSKSAPRPAWATSDLTVRLNWLNWTALGISENETAKFLNLFQLFGDMNKPANHF